MSTVEQLPAELNLHFVRGDDFTRRLFFYTLDDDGTTRIAENVSGWEITAQTRRSPNAVAVVDLGVDMSDAATGYVDITLTAAETATMPRVGVWDLQRVDGTTLTLLGGSMEVDPDVTREHGS